MNNNPAATSVDKIRFKEDLINLAKMAIIQDKMQKQIEEYLKTPTKLKENVDNTARNMADDAKEGAKKVRNEQVEKVKKEMENIHTVDDLITEMDRRPEFKRDVLNNKDDLQDVPLIYEYDKLLAKSDVLMDDVKNDIHAVFGDEASDAVLKTVKGIVDRKLRAFNSLDEANRNLRFTKSDFLQVGFQDENAEKLLNILSKKWNDTNKYSKFKKRPAENNNVSSPVQKAEIDTENIPQSVIDAAKNMPRGDVDDLVTDNENTTYEAPEYLKSENDDSNNEVIGMSKSKMELIVRNIQQIGRGNDSSPGI